MNGCMGIFRTISSLDAKGGRDEEELLGMLRCRQAAGGRRSWDWVKPLGMQAVYMRKGRLCQVTSCLHALGFASYIIRKEKREKGLCMECSLPDALS